MKKKYLQIFVIPGLLLGLGSSTFAESTLQFIDTPGGPSNGISSGSSTDFIAGFSTNSQNEIHVKLNRTIVHFPDAAPYIDPTSSRVLVPIRFVAEQLGSQVDWDATTQTVKMIKGSNTIQLTIGQNEAFVNGQAILFDSKATIANNRTYVPLRFISETFGAKVTWDPSSRTVDITEETSVAARNNMYKSAPAMTIDLDKSYTADVKTNLGSFKIELFAVDAPMTVNNFIFLVKDGFYNGITFHRIIKDFMVQTGDPLGNGTGEPGYSFADELPPKVGYTEGIVAMANAGPDTNGSQFFICTGEAAKQLNNTPYYTVFGKIVDGMDVVSKIAETPVGMSSYGEPSKPKVDVEIESITIE